MKIGSLILFCLLSATLVVAQVAQRQQHPPVSYGIVDTVIVIGNEKTKESVILREMTLKQGAEATPEALEWDRGRIYSIGLFTRVDVNVVPFEGKNMLIVDVNERWYIIPLPLFGFRDGDPKKPYFGAGLLHNNFRGLNQKLFGSVVFGYNPSLALSFSDPWIDREHDLFFSAGLSHSRIKNRSTLPSGVVPDFEELHYDVNSTLGKRFTLYQTLAINLGYRILKVTQQAPGRTVSPDGVDNFLYGSVIFTYDSRNLRDYTTSGTYASAYITKYGFGESELSFTRFGLDLRRFSPLPLDLTLATRFHGSVVSGSVVPTHVRAYFGYGERIRGYFRNVFEGENMAGASVELRIPILQPQTVMFTAIPMPREFSVWRLGLSAELFGDAGTTWFRGQNVSMNAIRSGYGGGLIFLLPYDVVVRTEYAWNDRRRGQFILGIRSAF